MIRDSVRARLTLWHTAVLALVLAAFSFETYSFLVDLTAARTNRLLEATARAFVHTFTVQLEESSSLDEAARRAAREFRFSSYRVLVYSENHQLLVMSDSTDVVPGLAVSELTTSDIAPLHHLLTPASLGRPTFGVLAVPNREMRAYATSVFVRGVPYVIAALELQSAEGEVLRTYLQAILISIPVALLLAGLGGYFLARKSLAPVMAMKDQAVQISSENLHERLPVQNPDDELGRLATGFNGLLTRLEKSFVYQRQFMADASHELRTPIAILMAETDIALSDPTRDSAEYQESLRVVRLEAKRMRQTVEDLFTLARADGGDREIPLETFYLEELLFDCVRQVSGLARSRDVTITFSPHDEAVFLGSEELMRRLVINLLDNAIRHTSSGGKVSVHLTVSASSYTVRVSDTGSGIPAESIPFIFDRFYRADPTRRRTGESARSGAGLGLAIARWVAEVHGGRLDLEATGPLGSTFTLELPASSGNHLASEARGNGKPDYIAPPDRMIVNPGLSSVG